VVSEADTDGAGRVKYRSFARVVAQLFSDFFEWRSTSPLPDENPSQYQSQSRNAKSASPARQKTENLGMTIHELERYFRQLFYQADVESNGFLAPREFSLLLDSAGLGFSRPTIRRIVEGARLSSSGQIDYIEYVPRMVEIVEEQRNKSSGKWDAGNGSPVDERRARASATEFLLQGVDRDWLERAMLKMLMQADAHNNGTLDASEFASCLHSLDLGLTRQEITYLISQIDATSAGGLIRYQEWAPLGFDAVVELVKEKFVEDPASLRLQEYIVDLIREYDIRQTGARYL